jgi:hypothetical protein
MSPGHWSPFGEVMRAPSRAPSSSSAWAFRSPIRNRDRSCGATWHRYGRTLRQAHHGLPDGGIGWSAEAIFSVKGRPGGWPGSRRRWTVRGLGERPGMHVLALGTTNPKNRQPEQRFHRNLFVSLLFLTLFSFAPDWAIHSLLGDVDGLRLRASCGSAVGRKPRPRFRPPRSLPWWARHAIGRLPVDGV